VNEKFRPESQSLVDDFERFGVVGRQSNALPPFTWHVRSFDGFQVEVQAAGCGVSSNSGVSRIGQRAATAVAESGDIVFISAEVLIFGGSVIQSAGPSKCARARYLLEFEAAVLIVYDLPHNLVRSHAVERSTLSETKI
jgi:hypothetical protein